MALSETESIACPCCGREKVELFDICTVCGWQNCDLQLERPDYTGGPNHGVSLNQARENYAKTGRAKPATNP